MGQSKMPITKQKQKNYGPHNYIIWVTIYYHTIHNIYTHFWPREEGGGGEGGEEKDIA